MKKTNSKRDNFNLFISAFLITAYIVCAFFFIGFAKTQTGIAQPLIVALSIILFGGILFYATRVGEGRIVTRFSIFTLLFLVVPALFLILVYVFRIMPVYSFVEDNNFIFTLACVAFGYGLPYTFISGFETALPETEEVAEEEFEDTILKDIEADEEKPQEDEVEEEIIVENAETQEVEKTEEVVENNEETEEVKEEIIEE